MRNLVICLQISELVGVVDRGADVWEHLVRVILAERSDRLGLQDAIDTGEFRFSRFTNLV